MKIYTGYVNDHSGSMADVAEAAAEDFNAKIAAVKDAASREQLNSIVSVVGIGLDNRETGKQVKRQLVVSNPHVLKPLTRWPCPGGTPLYDGIGDIIELHESLPDYADPQVSILIEITTDGQEQHSTTKWRSQNLLKNKIEELQKTGRWTFAARVPPGHASSMREIGIPSGNIYEWNITKEGMAEATVRTQAATNTFYKSKAAGVNSTNVFYTNTQAVDTSKLVNIKDKTSLYVVDKSQNGGMIKDFILTKRMEYLVGAAFYQLTKTEARVAPTKLILIRDRKTGDVYAGNEARTMIGLDTLNNARLHPNHGNGNYDIFIQSESVNRKLVAGTGVLYWAEKGRPMTEEDLKYLKPKTVAAPAVPQLVQAPASGKPTPSPVVAKKASVYLAHPFATVNQQVQSFVSREEARSYARKHGKSVKDAQALCVPWPGGKRWFV